VAASIHMAFSGVNIYTTFQVYYYAAFAAAATAVSIFNPARNQSLI